MKRGALLAIEVYQKALSPYVPGACRYQPTCSNYAHQAIARHGVVRGVWLSARRLARCTPFGKAGNDPVP